MPSSVTPLVSMGDTTETSRRWSNSVKSRLAQLSDLFVNGETATVASSAMADRIEIFDPAQLQANEVYQGPTVKVVELRPSVEHVLDARIQAETSDFISAIQELLCLATDPTTDSAKFKLFGITADGERLKTRQRLTTQGTLDGKQLRSYAVVDAIWTTSKGKETEPSLKLTGFLMSTLVRTELAYPPKGRFEDVAAGVLGGNAAWNEQLRHGMNIWARRIDRSLNPDFLGYHGLAIGDVNGDTLEDLYLCQPGGLPNLLFRQQADGSLIDVSRAAGVDWLDNSTGALLIDLDNDGDKDLAVATRVAFLVMENDGAGKFSERGRFSNIATGYSPTAADFDVDGDLDLLVLRYTSSDNKVGDFPTPHPFHDARNGGANVLLRNDGDFRFSDVTDEYGLGNDNRRFSFSASWEDYDNDGDLDLYVANDFGPNQLFRNELRGFTDVSELSGTQDWGFGMSATWADYNCDGNMDLYVSSMFSGAGNQIVAKTDFNPTMPDETRHKYLKMVRGNTLLRNLGDGRFTDVTSPMDEGFGGWAWGSKFADFNNDGWEDLYVANGYISQPDKDDL